VPNPDITIRTFFIAVRHRQVAALSNAAKHVHEGIHMAIIDLAFNKTVAAALEAAHEPPPPKALPPPPRRAGAGAGAGYIG
jgi:hypothetical protein